MPAVRDFTVAYEANTADAGLTIPMCAYQEGDLLLAFCTGDTGAPTWGCSNGVGTWTQLFALNNTCSNVCFWKYAAASGEGDVVFTSNVNETYSGMVVSIKAPYEFYTASSPPLSSVTTQAAATRFTMPQVTTTTNDNLIILFVGSTATAPSVHFVEGILQELCKVDGAAEGCGLGWFYQRSAGLTPAVNAGVMVTGAGVKATIAIRPPVSAANVVPAYPVSDPSIYITPSFGVAFNGNTAIASNTTNFGTTINGITVNGATVANVADIGLDVGVYMSMAGVTNAATANQISSATAAVASTYYNVGNRNILTHIRHPTPVQNQRLSPLSSGRGVWFGMKSGTTAGTDYKVWQVHGSDVNIRPGSTQPVIVNAANTDTIGTAGTLNNTDVRIYGIFNGGLDVLTQQIAIGPTWAMDTTVIAGGDSNNPIDAAALVNCIANNKNRLSAVLQGKNQVLLLQKVQIGDGGTNPVVFKLTSSAVEFPSRRNLASKIVNYNGIDNSVGLILYPGSSDIIDVSSSTFASASRYEFSLHSSASASANYNFSGTTVIGAGIVSLARPITIDGMTINNYSSLDLSGATFTNGNIVNPPSTNNSLTVSTSSTISNTKINASTVAPGNYLCSTSTPSVFQYCSFTGGGGHAIRITSPGTYTFTGNKFTNFGGDGTNGAAIFNDSGGLVTLNIVGGGDTPTVRNGTGASTVVNNSITITVVAKTVDNTLVSGARVLLLADSGGVLPANASVTITRSGSTAIVSHTNHGLKNGAMVMIKGANEQEYNGVHTITYIDANSYSYTVSGTPSTPATGSITATAVIISGLTDSSGEISVSYSITGTQPLIGRVRKSTSAPYYKTAIISGNAVSGSNLSLTAIMIED